MESRGSALSSFCLRPGVGLATPESPTGQPRDAKLGPSLVMGTHGVNGG